METILHFFNVIFLHHTINGKGQREHNWWHKNTHVHIKIKSYKLKKQKKVSEKLDAQRILTWTWRTCFFFLLNWPTNFVAYLLNFWHINVPSADKGKRTTLKSIEKLVYTWEIKSVIIIWIRKFHTWQYSASSPRYINLQWWIVWETWWNSRK